MKIDYELLDGKTAWIDLDAKEFFELLRNLKQNEA